MIENNIVYCNDKLYFQKLLNDFGVLSVLRIPLRVKSLFNCIIFTPQMMNRRGSSKYGTFTYKGDFLGDKEIEEHIGSIGKGAIYTTHLNDYHTVSIFNNNLTTLLKALENLAKLLVSRTKQEPILNLSTDIPNLSCNQYFCCDIASYMQMMQLTDFTTQTGDIYLSLGDNIGDYITFLLITCINANGKIKIHLLCDAFDRDLWIQRNIQALQELNVNLDFTILYKIVDCIDLP